MMIDCYVTASKSKEERYLQQIVAIRRRCRKSLIFRAAIPYKQEVAGSSPALPTILLFLQIRLQSRPESPRKFQEHLEQ
jgi:hypothetical protein